MSITKKIKGRDLFTLTTIKYSDYYVFFKISFMERYKVWKNYSQRTMVNLNSKTTCFLYGHHQKSSQTAVSILPAIATLKSAVSELIKYSIRWRCNRTIWFQFARCRGICGICSGIDFVLELMATDLSRNRARLHIVYFLFLILKIIN